MTNSTSKRFAVPAALVIGGVTVGSFVAPIGLASANTTDDGDATESDATADDAGSAEDEATDGEGRRGHRRARIAAGADVLEDVLGLEAREIRDQLADGNSLADVAEAQGVSTEDLTAALVAAANERIDEAEAAGKIDAERAAGLRDGLDERVAELVERVPSEDVGERRGHRHRGHLGFGGLKAGTEAASEVLGLTAEEIRDGLDDGKSLADLAEEQGVSTDDLAAALVAEATERLDQAVADGKIEADRAAEAAERLEEMIDRAIEAEPFTLGRGIGRAEGHRGFHRHHRGGDATTDGEVVESTLTDV